MTKNRQRADDQKPGRYIAEKFKKRTVHLEAKSMRQLQYIEALEDSDQVIVTGSAGTGKTYIAASWAAKLFLENKIKKIILTRPNVASGRSLGFFPGTMEEKMAPWVIPFTDVITQHLGTAAYEIAVKRRNIEIVPFEVMRGRTFDDSFVILDEGQNTTPTEMKMFLTRIGEGTRVVINGDIKQTDLKSTSGLKTILDMAISQRLPVPHVEFTVDDIVRSGICGMWVRAFDAVGI
jgi:phosphate starvation-inducible protein PhoH and related proteins